MPHTGTQGSSGQGEEGLDHYGKMLLAALVGAMAGALAGILLAPDRGAETRRRLRAGVLRCCASTREKLRPLLRCACGVGDEAQEEAG